jgi:acetoin utilization deacetylase AcuC-like enzyme
MCFLQDDDLMIVDMYNPDAFPHDEEAKRAIDIDVPLPPGTDDAAYIAKLSVALSAVRESAWKVDMVFFNAGVDVLKDEGTGRLALTPEGVAARDELVWSLAVELQVPICMTLGGGYGPGSVDAVCQSLANLVSKFKLNVS